MLDWAKNRIPTQLIPKKIKKTQFRSALKSSKSPDLKTDLTALVDQDVLYPPCVGQFTPIRMVEDRDIIDRFEHIPCNAGDLVCWDYRIPHANSFKNNTPHTREAVYIGLLPDIELNRSYVENQLERFKRGLVPSDQWHSHKKSQNCDYIFSTLGRKLMSIDPWE
jgi:ectoine hydroxylase-related dioxygenase (phytanoyl-CoA dioxygenase family)